MIELLLLSQLIVTSTAAGAPGSMPLMAPQGAVEAPPAAPRAAPPSADNPPPARASEAIIRGQEGDWGLMFRFGGFGTLFATGNARTTDISGQSPTNVVLTQAGLKMVLSEEWMVPIYFGSGMRRFALDENSRGSATDWGIDAGIGVEYHFRIWRRISPFVSATVGLGYSNPSGEDNAAMAFSIRPGIGVEYYVFDRVSLQAMYLFNLQIDRYFSGLTSTQLVTQAGGAMNLTFYF